MGVTFFTRFLSCSSTQRCPHAGWAFIER